MLFALSNTRSSRPYSNTLELFLLGAIYRVSPLKSLSACFLVGMLSVTGSYVRITFPVFAWPVVLYHILSRPAPSRLAMNIAGGILTLSAFLVYDMNHYGRWVFPPLNNAIYNSKIENLQLHGLHPWYTQILIGMPLLFAPLLFSLKPRISTTQDLICLATILSGLVVLSIVPHQEPRFLLPLLLPLVLLQKNARPSKFIRYIMILHIGIAGFYAFAHQATVVSCAMKEVEGKCTAFYETDPPPSALAKGQVIHFMDGSIEEIVAETLSANCSLVIPRWILPIIYFYLFFSLFFPDQSNSSQTFILALS
jgi:phosphatidylinositol glycan class Z